VTTTVPALPRLTPGALTRARLTAWLDRHADVPLRLIAAPAGNGKTTSIVHYLHQSPRRWGYVALRDDDAPEQMRERIAAALGIEPPPADHRALVAALERTAPCELAIDNADRPTPEAIDELLALVRDVPAGVSLIYAVRSRAALDATRYIALGTAVLLDDNQLAFDADDVARMCEWFQIAFSPGDVARLIEETEGWPLVTHWVLREASSGGGGIVGAYDRWRRTSGRHFADYLDDELKRSGESMRATFHAALAANGPNEERERLAMLEARGLFVRFAAGAYRPYRVARQFDLESGAPQRASSPIVHDPGALLVVRMFGRFEAEIGGRRIEWIRRREAQIFKYLLLKPDGAASRTELREIFWPDASPHLATQSIRTASSNIRKAIAAIVGYGNVDRYFTSRGDMAVEVANAVIDLRRFTAHVADGDAELDAGRLQEALAHYRAAEALYGGELLSGDYPEPWYAPRAEMYRSLYISVVEKLAEIYSEIGRERRAREYAERAAELRGVVSLDAARQARGLGA
jgi:tetratricopeptide (TPR) repeat protein